MVLIKSSAADSEEKGVVTMLYRSSTEANPVLSRLSTASFVVRRSKKRFGDSPPFLAVYVRGDHTTPQAIAKHVWSELKGFSSNKRYDKYHYVINSTSMLVHAALPKHGLDVDWIQVDSGSFTVNVSKISTSGRGWHLVRVVIAHEGVLPWNRGGARHAVLVAVHDGTPYVYDPNGPLYNKGEQGDWQSSGSPKVVRRAFAAVAHAMGKKIDLDNKETYLFQDQRISQAHTLRWMDSKGLCGAYADFVMCMIIMNSQMSPHQIREMVKFRVSQWNAFQDSESQMRRQIRDLRKLSDPSVVLGGASKTPLLASRTQADELAKTCTTRDDISRRKAIQGEIEAWSEQPYSTAGHIRLNLQLDQVNRSIKKQNAFSRLAFEHPLDAYVECPGMISVWMGDMSVDEHVADTLESFKLRDGHAAVRKEVIASGSFLDWFELQAIIFIAYALELAQEFKRDPPSEIRVERAPHATWDASPLFGDYRWNGTMYVGSGARRIERQDGQDEYSTTWIFESSRTRFHYRGAWTPLGVDRNPSLPFTVRIIKI